MECTRRINKSVSLCSRSLIYRRSVLKQTALLVLVLVALVAATIYVAVDTWMQIDADMTWHGWLALFLGVTLTAGVGVGLMRLVFFSARNGHDDIDDDI